VTRIFTGSSGRSPRAHDDNREQGDAEQWHLDPGEEVPDEGQRAEAVHPQRGQLRAGQRDRRAVVDRRHPDRGEDQRAAEQDPDGQEGDEFHVAMDGAQVRPECRELPDRPVAHWRAVEDR
jgi:hypothetical protein